MLLENDRKRYEVLLKHAAQLLTPSQLSVLKLSLSLHIYSPKVQMFQQIASEQNLPTCQCVVDVGGQVSCDLNEIRSLIEKVWLFHVDNYTVLDKVFFL